MRDASILFHPVQDAGDLARLEAALRALSADLSERYATDSATLAGAVLGARPAAYGLLAQQGDQTLGAALFSPVFSTVRGGAGVYVSDLWVSAQARGQGLGTRLLARIAREGHARWQAIWLKLAVYEHSHGAQQFYARLGFEPTRGLQDMRLGPEGVTELIRGVA